MKKKKMLKPGKTQVHSDDVGIGIYCTPYVSTALNYVEDGFEMEVYGVK
jgi:hypothetical protein